MEKWLPLFEILLNSPSPEGEASIWFLEQRDHLHSPSSPATASPPTDAFLSLLLSPLHSLSSRATSSTSITPRIWIQTLPFAIQTRILSFLASEIQRFCPHLIRSLASHILISDLPSSSDHPAFWVRRAARYLLDMLPAPIIEADQQEGDEFDSLPHWLEAAAKTSTPVLPWLPVNLIQLQKAATSELVKKSRSNVTVSRNEMTKPFIESEVGYAAPPLHFLVLDQAAAMKAEVLASDSTADSLCLAHKFQQLCLESGAGSELKLLELIEPWEANDETLSGLLLHLTSDSHLFSKSWPSYVVRYMALPKLLILQSPVSRALLSATICFCKQHQTAAVEALIFPLLLHKEGINSVICDVLVKIIKECLHKFHVSAFCQRLLCGGGEARRSVCLPCHRDLISDQLVWTESLFNLFQHILNLDVHFTPDTNDKLVSVVLEMTTKFSKSLKFGNFLLSFVTKCSYAVKTHKVVLRDATEKTSTLVTRSILSKLNA